MTLEQTDIAVVGSGMVGGALALGLAQKGLKVAVLERSVPKMFNPLAKPDVRILALSLASINLLCGLGVWDAICRMRVHPYRRLETWEWNSAHVIFDASELKLPQLGYMVEQHVLQLALWQALVAHPGVILHNTSSLKELRRNEQGYHLTLNNDDELLVKLVVGADGANSQVRKMANISTHTRQYRQSCMLITVKCTNNPGDSTWQHFTPKGPHAFLPLFERWASLVWYDAPTRIRQLKKLSMPQLENEIAYHFPDRLGKVTPVAVDSFLLIRQHALSYTREGLVLIGDAAHTIHPLAGQGVNLGYRDVEALLNVLGCAYTNGELWTSQAVLSRYQHRRMIDNFIMQIGMDLFYGAFNNRFKPMKLLRNIGLMAVERSGYLKRQALRYALGFYSIPLDIRDLLIQGISKVLELIN